MYEAQKRWREKNIEKVRLINLNYREKNREKIREIGKRYRDKNREKLLAYKKTYRKKNAEKIREGKRRWLLNKIHSDPEYALRYYLRLEELKLKYGKKSKRRFPIPPSVRLQVFKRDKFTCRYCGNKAPNVAIVIDHIIPVSKDGENNLDNLITACEYCNSGKGDKYL